MTDTSLTASRSAAATPQHGVSLAEAFRVWLRVAALSFGGPAGQIAVMHRIIVDEKKWVGESALSACAELLHAAAGAGSPSAGDLYRLADASLARRHHCRRPVRAARHRLDHGAQLHLCGVRQRAGDYRAVFGPQGRGAGDRAAGGAAGRGPRPEKPADVHPGRARLYRHFLFRRALSGDRDRGRPHRFCRGSRRLNRLSGWRRSWWRRQSRNR